MNASEEAVLSVSGQKDSQDMYYNWYLDNTFQNKVRAMHLSEILPISTYYEEKAHSLSVVFCHRGALEIAGKTKAWGCCVWEWL